VAAGYYFGIPVSGTHAHSFVMFFPTNFRHSINTQKYSKSSLFLVDTYDIYTGLVNAIQVAHEMEAMGQDARGVRIDSGDLVWWSTVAHVMFERPGCPNCVSC